MSEFEQLAKALSRQDPRHYGRYFERAAVMIFDEVAGLIDISRREQFEAIESKYLKVIATMCEGTAVPASTGHKVRRRAELKRPKEGDKENHERAQQCISAWKKRGNPKPTKTQMLNKLARELSVGRSTLYDWEEQGHIKF